MSFEEKDLTGDTEGLSAYEAEALTDWEYKFMSKYVRVGTVKQSPVLDKSEQIPTVSGGRETAAPDAGSETVKAQWSSKLFLSLWNWGPSETGI